MDRKQTLEDHYGAEGKLPAAFPRLVSLTKAPVTAQCTDSQVNECYTVYTTGLFGKHPHWRSETSDLSGGSVKGGGGGVGGSNNNNNNNNNNNHCVPTTLIITVTCVTFMDSRWEKHTWQVFEQAWKSACRVTFVKYTCRGNAFSRKILGVILTFVFGRVQRLKHDASGSPVPGHVCFDAVLSGVYKTTVSIATSQQTHHISSQRPASFETMILNT